MKEIFKRFVWAFKAYKHIITGGKFILFGEMKEPDGVGNNSVEIFKIKDFPKIPEQCIRTVYSIDKND